MSRFDVVTFTISTTIAVLGLFVAVCVWRQSRRDAELAKETAVMSVKPHLSLNTQLHPQKGIYEVSIQNSGVGPALIKSFTVYLDGQEVNANEHVKTFDNAVLQLRLAVKEHYTSAFGINSGFPAGVEERLLRIELQKENLPFKKAVLEQINRLDLKIEYTDLYGNPMIAYDSRELGEGF